MIKSEIIAQKYFKSLGFTVKDMHERKQACDIILSLMYEGERYFVKVEVKRLNERLLRPQLNMLLDGGLIVYVDIDKKEVKQIYTKEDLDTNKIRIETIEHITPTWKK